MKSRVIPENQILSLNCESDVYVVKYNLDGNYIMSG